MGKRPEAGSTSPGAPSALSSRVPKQPSSFGLAGFASWFYFIMFFFLLKGCGVSISLVQSEIGNLMDQQTKKMKRGFSSWF